MGLPKTFVTFIFLVTLKLGITEPDTAKTDCYLANKCDNMLEIVLAFHENTCGAG